MAIRKIPTVEAVVETLSTTAPREAAFLEMFQLADPEQGLTYPDLLRACCALLERAAEDARRRGEPAEAKRRIDDTLHLAAIADFILTAEDAAEKSRLQDIDEPGLARLVELAGQLAPRARSIEAIVEALRGIKAGILGYIDTLDAPDNGPDDDR